MVRDSQEIADRLDLELLSYRRTQLSAQHPDFGKVHIPQKASNSGIAQYGLLIRLLVSCT